MEYQIFVKNNVVLSNSNKAVIKTKWKSKDNNVEFVIFDRQTSFIYIGQIELDKLQKQKTGVNFDTIKATLISDETVEGINYELDSERLKFCVFAQEAFDSENSLCEIIYLKIDLKRTEKDATMNVLFEQLDDMSATQKENNKLNDELTKIQLQLKELSEKFEKLAEEKAEFNSTCYSSFISLLNSKKKRILELEKKLQTTKMGKDRNKFLNISSDFDKSDVSSSDLKFVEHSPKKSLSKVIKVDESSDYSEKPSTSSRKKISPSKSYRTEMGTPKKKSLINFKKLLNSDDSEEDIFKKAKRQSPRALRKRSSFEAVSTNNSGIFEGFQLKINKKFNKGDERNQSSAELFIPKPKENNKSTSSDTSGKSREKSTTPDFLQPAQVLDFEEIAPKELVERKNGSDDDCSVKDPSSDDEIVQNSQPDESPSIFRSFSKRKSEQINQSKSKRTKLAFNKSKFSDDTIDILADESP